MPERQIRTPTLAATFTLALLMSSSLAHGMPLGGSVSAGQASISSGSTLTTVNQSSSRAVIDWRSFNVSSNETVKFNQPSTSSITLNRVSPSTGASQIDGMISANGNVWVTNPNGVVFGKNAQVNVGGMLATTGTISNSSFMSGSNEFTPGGNPNASVVNNGSITVNQAGLAALVAPNVVNNGSITAKLGKVQLASGDSFTLDMYGDGLINLQASPAITSQLVSNSGTIRANGGSVTLTAAAATNVVDSLINMDGAIEAKNVGDKTGSITLYAQGSNAVVNNVAADKGQLSGTSTVLVSGALTASGYGKGQQGGTVQVLGDNVGILSGAKIDASGSTGGGTIRIGGDFHGAGTTPTSLHTIVESGTSITANAITTGNGGNVTVWADDWTDYAGSIEARGGTLSGNGGYVETSGHNTLSMDGTVNASAPKGDAGTWLLDPNNVTITNTASTNMGSSPNFSDTGSPANVNTADIVSALNGGTSVNVTASGSIAVNNSIVESTYSGTESLTLAAGTDVTVATNVAINASGATKLNVTLDSDTAAAGGAIVLNSGSSITSNGGNIVLGGGATPATGYAVGDAADAHGVNITNATLNAGGGNITINGQGVTTGGDGIFVNSGGTIQTSGNGAITLTGIGGGTGASAGNYGIYVQGAVKSTSGAGGITLIGYSGDNGGSGSSNFGAYLSGTVTSVNGNILIDGNTGVGGQTLSTTTGGTSSTTGNFGIYDTGSISSTGNATITLSGIGAGSGASNNDYGVYIGTSGTVGSATGNLTFTGTGGNTTGGGDIGVIIGGGTTVQSTAMAAISMTGIGGGTGASTGDYGINIAGTVRSTASGGGGLTLIGYGGDVDGTGGSNIGTYIAGGTVTSVSGNILIDGNTGISGQGITTSSGVNNYGIDITNPGTVSSTGNATITMNGIGGGSGASTGNEGIYLTGTGAQVSSVTGNISLTGTGGATNGSSDYGLNENTGAVIQTTGAAPISLTGFGGGTGAGGSDLGLTLSGMVKSTATSGGGLTIIGYGGDTGGSGGSNYGIQLSGATVSSVDGAIVIDGNTGLSGQAVSTATGGGNHGIYLTASTVSSTGNATIAFNGIGGGSGASVTYGVYLGGGSGTVTSATGNISLTGTGAATAGNTDYGVLVNTGTTVQSTGSATVSVTGIGGGSGASGSDFGVDVAGSVQSTATGGGGLTIIGYGGDMGGSGASNVGVGISGTVTSVDGAILIDGNTGINGHAVTNTTGGASGTSNYGVAVFGTVSSTGNATVAVNGIGAGTGVDAAADGMMVTGTIASVTGNIALTGTGSTGTGSNEDGVQINSPGIVRSTGSAAISINGYGNGSGSGGADTGIYLQSGASIQSTAATGGGSLTLIGYGGDIGGTGGSNIGTYIAGGTVTSVSGNILIDGNTGINGQALSSATGSSNDGIYSSGTISTTGSATIALNGIGGGAGAGGSDSGTYLTGTVKSTATGGGGITVTGYSGDNGGTGASNYGTCINGGTVSSVSGDIIIDGNTGISAQTVSTTTGSSDYGIYNSGILSSTGYATITLNGVGAGSGSSGYSAGVYQNLAGAQINSASGNISITGTAASTTGDSQWGIIINSGTIQSSGSATIKLTGIGGSNANGIASYTSGYIGGASDTGKITFDADTISLASTPIQTTGTVTFAPYTASTTVGVAGGAGTLGVTSAILSNVTAGGITIGATSDTGATTLNAYAWNAPLTLLNGSGSININGAEAMGGNSLLAESLSGNITLGGSGSVTSSATGTAITLAASGGDFINNAGTAALSASGGRWLVYSATSWADTFGSLNSGNTAMWDATYGGTITQTGDRYVFAYQPTISFTSLSIGKTYGTDDTAAVATDYTVSGLQAGVANAYLADTNTTAFSGAPSVTSLGATALAQVSGGPYTVSVAQGTLAGIDGYALGSYTSSGLLTITPATLTGVITANNKVYDGTTMATPRSESLSGTTYGSDASNLVLEVGAANFNSKDVLTANTVTATGLSLSGSAASDYQLSSTSAIASASITPAPLTGDIKANNKVYDGTTIATPRSESLSGTTYGSDASNLVLEVGAANFNSKDVLTANTVTATGLTLSGSAASDYQLSSTSATASASITPATLSASLTGTVDKTYDQTIAATLAANNYSLSGVFSGDMVSLNNQVSGTYDTANVGAGKTVTVSGLSLLGAQAGDYVLASSSITGAVGEIDAKTLTATLTGTVAKTYDGTAAAMLAANNYSLSGTINGDTVSLNNPATGSYDTANVGTGKTVSVNGLSISGTSSGNYTLTSPSINGGVGEINGKVVNVTADNESKFSGAYTPTLAYSYSDSGNLPVSFSGGLFTPATLTSRPGSYAITQGTLAADGNYDLLFTPATLTITPLPTTVIMAPVEFFPGLASYGVPPIVMPPTQTGAQAASDAQRPLHSMNPTAGSGSLKGLIYIDTPLMATFGLDRSAISTWADGVLSGER